MGGDLPGRQALGRQRQHHVVHASEAALVLAHDHRLERPIPITGDLDVDRTDIGDHRLGPRPIAAVATITALDGMLLIAEMTVHLALQAGLKDALREVPEKPARARQFDSLGTSSIDELLRELLIGNRLIGHWSYSPARRL